MRWNERGGRHYATLGQITAIVAPGNEPESWQVTLRLKELLWDEDGAKCFAEDLIQALDDAGLASGHDPPIGCPKVIQV